MRTRMAEWTQHGARSEAVRCANVSSGQCATIYVEDSAGNLPRSGRRQKRDRRSDVLRLTEAAKLPHDLQPGDAAVANGSALRSIPDDDAAVRGPAREGDVVGMDEEAGSAAHVVTGVRPERDRDRRGVVDCAFQRIPALGIGPMSSVHCRSGLFFPAPEPAYPVARPHSGQQVL